MNKKDSVILKISIYLIVALLITYLGFTTINYISIQNKIYAELEMNSKQKLERLQNGLLTPMWNMNNKEGDILASLEMDKKFVYGIKVVQNDGRGFVSKKFDKLDSLCNDTVFEEKDYYSFLQALIIKGTDTLGTVFLYNHNRQIKKALQNELLFGILTSLVQIFILTIVLFFLIKKVMISPLTLILDRLKDIAKGEGDLTKRLDIQSKDEIGMLAIEFNTFIEKLQSIIILINSKVKIVLDTSEILAESSTKIASTTQEISSQTSTVASASEEATSNVTNISDNAETMSTSVNMVATAIEEISASFNEVSKNCQNELEIATKANKQVKHTKTIMGKLSDAAKEITKIVDVINDIANQTNLLALNATIEAATAGEAGKGFAVVANEVKELAKQSALATREIEGQISNMFNMTNNAVAEINSISSVIEDINVISQSIAGAVEEQSVTTNEIAGNVGNANNAASVIARNVQETASGLSEVSSNIQNVDSAVNETASNITNISNSAEGMKQNAIDLNDIVGQFKV